jgi:hypothetical protein
MRSRIWLSITTALVFFVAMAVAQTPSMQDQSQGSSPASTAGSQGRSPEGTSSPSDMNSQTSAGQQQSGQGQGSASQQAPGYGNVGGNQGAKGEKKLKGCVESSGGQYMLKTKSGKEIPLTGQDISAHSGHEVVVHGSWSSTGETSGTSGMAKSDHAFNVDSIDHLSDTCSGAGNGKTGSSMQQPQ